jgi:hypothetical protein
MNVNLSTYPYVDDFGVWHPGDFIGSADLVAEAIDYDALVTSEFDYTMAVTLRPMILFDYWWEMGDEPPSYEPGHMFDVMVLQAGEGWQYLGQIDAYGSSTGWQMAMLGVPENLWGTDAQVRFVLNDYDPETRPRVYLRNVSVPEPSTMALMGVAFIWLIGLGSRLKRGTIQSDMADHDARTGN